MLKLCHGSDFRIIVFFLCLWAILWSPVYSLRKGPQLLSSFSLNIFIYCRLSCCFYLGNGENIWYLIQTAEIQFCGRLGPFYIWCLLKTVVWILDTTRTRHPVIYIYIYIIYIYDCWKKVQSQVICMTMVSWIIPVVRQSKTDLNRRQMMRPLRHGGSHFVNLHTQSGQYNNTIIMELSPF